MMIHLFIYLYHIVILSSLFQAITPDQNDESHLYTTIGDLQSTNRRVAAVTVSPTEATGPRQWRLERGEHVVQAVGDDDVIVNGYY